MIIQEIYSGQAHTPDLDSDMVSGITSDIVSGLASGRALNMTSDITSGMAPGILFKYMTVKNPFIGTSIIEFETQMQLRVLAIQRDKELLMPRGNSIIRQHDILFVEQSTTK